MNTGATTTIRIPDPKEKRFASGYPSKVHRNAGRKPDDHRERRCRGFTAMLGGWLLAVPAAIYPPRRAAHCISIA